MSNKQTSFCQTLGNLQHGYSLQELDQLLTEALQASQDTVTYIREGKVIDNGDGTETDLLGVNSDVTILEGSVN